MSCNNDEKDQEQCPNNTQKANDNNIPKGRERKSSFIKSMRDNNNTAPAKWTNENIDHMRSQLKQLGLSIDWD